MTLDLDQRLKRGQAAERLLSDEMFVAAGLEVAAAIRDEMFKTKPDEAGRREALYAEYKGFQAALKRLDGWKSDGLIAAAELQRTEDKP
jgi:hypothetical protein